MKIGQLVQKLWRIKDHKLLTKISGRVLGVGAIQITMKIKKSAIKYQSLLHTKINLKDQIGWLYFYLFFYQGCPQLWQVGSSVSVLTSEFLSGCVQITLPPVVEELCCCPTHHWVQQLMMIIHEKNNFLFHSVAVKIY